ncbi:MAG TPA: lipocalin family protein [Acidobacteriota bacterium]
MQAHLRNPAKILQKRGSTLANCLPIKSLIALIQRLVLTYVVTRAGAGNFYEVNTLIESRLNTFPTNKTLGNFKSKINFMKPIFIVAILFFSAFTACKKDSNNDKPKTNTDLLTQASWKFSNASASGFGDITSQIPDCYKDNSYTFSSTGQGAVDESTIVCSPSSAGPFTWNFANNETQLHISTTLFQNGSSDFTIISLSETNLVVSQTMTVAPLPPTTVTVTFVHP